MTAIEKNAFKNNKKLKKLTIGSNIKSIGTKAFYKCTSLKKITISSNATKIGKQAFKGIYKKASFKITGAKKAKSAMKKKLKSKKIGYVKTWKIK